MKRQRFAAIDMARGIAILAMIVYHFAWDLGFTGVIDLDVTIEPGWVVFQRAIVSAFLFLTGVSLVLAHGDGIRWGAFWRRTMLIGGAALLVTIGTYAFSPESFVFFGVLHAIALFGFMGLLFLQLPAVLVIAAAAGILALPLVIQSDLFATRWLAWIGLWEVPPPSEDLVPVLPWFGAVLLGLGTARWAESKGGFNRLRAAGSVGWPARMLAVAGRWSLLIYLVHQPLMLGGLLLATGGGLVSERSRADNFSMSCQSSCGEAGSETGYCTRYCSCALEEITTRDLWAMLENEDRSADEAAELQTLVDQCAVRAIDQI